MTAKAREESVCTLFQLRLLNLYVMENSAVLNFLLESFASNTPNVTIKITKEN